MSDDHFPDDVMRQGYQAQADALTPQQIRDEVTRHPRVELEDADWFLVRAGETAPLTGGHGSWVETDHPAVVACMGSDPACAAEGCQLRRQADTLRAQVEALTIHIRKIPGSQAKQEMFLCSDVLALLDARAKETR